MSTLVCFVLVVHISTASSALFAIGDVHGDVEQLKAMLQLCQVVNASGNWTGGNATVVQVGDIFDRGPEDFEAAAFLMHLREEAAVAGGTVAILLGNHELMNLESAFHYAHPDSLQGEARKAALASGTPIGDFVRSFNLTYVSMNTLFVHAGLDARYLSESEDALTSLNSEGQDALQSNWFKAPLFGIHGPLWTRRIVNEAISGDCDRVKSTLSQVKLDRMVVGHTPQRSGHVEAYCDDRLIVVDVGMSKWMYGHLSALELSSNDIGEIEMREVFGQYTDDHGKADGATPKTLEEALRADASLLQEVLETVEEKVRD